MLTDLVISDEDDDDEPDELYDEEDETAEDSDDVDADDESEPVEQPVERRVVIDSGIHSSEILMR